MFKVVCCRIVVFLLLSLCFQNAVGVRKLLYSGKGLMFSWWRSMLMLLFPTSEHFWRRCGIRKSFSKHISTFLYIKLYLFVILYPHFRFYWNNMIVLFTSFQSNYKYQNTYIIRLLILYTMIQQICSRRHWTYSCAIFGIICLL